MPDYKQLCAEGVAFIRSATDPDDLSINAEKWANKARAALAEPEPEGPTDNELEEEFGRALLNLPGDSMNATAVAFARAVLARWGNHSAPQPIPVSERLPGPEDCDAEGRCWWLKERANPDHDLLMPTWHLQRQGPAGTRFFRFTHWLPAHALPVPEEVV